MGIKDLIKRFVLISPELADSLVDYMKAKGFRQSAIKGVLFTKMVLPQVVKLLLIFAAVPLWILCMGIAKTDALLAVILLSVFFALLAAIHFGGKYIGRRIMIHEIRRVKKERKTKTAS